MDVLASLSSGAITGLMGGVGTLAKDIRQAITGELPAEKQAEVQQKFLEIESMLMTAQTAINLKEAESEKLFIAGWRPFIGWVGGFSLAYAAIFQPFLIFVAKWTGTEVIFPTLDTTITLQVLIGILGLGAYRSYDKKQEPSPAGKE